MSKNLKKVEVIIIGAGPAGIGAAIALKKAGVDFMILESSAPGGKINIAPRVDNYPGQFQISGPDLAYVFYERLINENIKIQGEMVLSLSKEKDGFKIEGEQNIYEARAVLIATGAKEKKIGLKNEDEFLGKGISYCSLCDGHFFKDQVIAVIGGGNSALKEAIHLSGIVKKLYLIHRRNEFRGTTKLLNEAKEKSNIEVLTPYVPLEILGEEKIEGLVIQNTETKEIKTLELSGLFPLVGQNPNTDFIKIPDVLDDYRSVPVDNKTMMTKVDGLFAAGDVLPRLIKQIYLSEHDGKVAAKNIIEYLQK